jgi:hypothetical protein
MFRGRRAPDAGKDHPSLHCSGHGQYGGGGVSVHEAPRFASDDERRVRATENMPRCPLIATARTASGTCRFTMVGWRTCQASEEVSL